MHHDYEATCLSEAAFINVTLTRDPLSFKVPLEGSVAVNGGSENTSLKFFVLILSKLPVQAAYRIWVQQDSDALMVACP